MKDSYNILLRLAGFQMGFKTYFTFGSFNEGIYNCCLASCCFFLFFFRLYCCTKTDQRVLIFLSPKMTGTQSRPSGNKSTSPQIKKKKKKVNACCLPWPAPFHLWKQPNQILWLSLHYCYFFCWCISLTVVWNIRSYYYFYVLLFNFVLV